MKRKLLLVLLMLPIAMVFGAFQAFAALAASAALPAKMWIASSEANGIPADIELFEGRNVQAAADYLLFLPGNVDPEGCFLSWDGDSLAIVDGKSYTNGTCPIPLAGTVKTYAFKDGDVVTESITVKTYTGSANVLPVFIDIDESLGTIAAMDRDGTHRASCSGRINIGGQWYEMPKIKGRGHFTWTASADKRPYNVTLGSKTTIPGIDSAATKKWSFLAEVTDHSLLRNRVGFHLARKLGIGHDTASADVWMNGEYQGCYTVTPKNDSFVNKGGYMIEEDNYKEALSVEEGGDPQFELEGLYGTGSVRNLITVKKIGDDLLKTDGVVDESAEKRKAVASEIRAWLQEAWDAIWSGDGYNDAGRYYTDYIDTESFAKMYLVQEYVKNYDICTGSFLAHREGTSEDDKLIAGPVWDLDAALGVVLTSSSLADLRTGRGTFITEVDESWTKSLFKTLGLHEDFMDEVRRQYASNRSVFDNLESDTARMIDEVEASAMMNHVKVKDLYKCNLHKYSTETVFGQRTEYEQRMLATTDSKTDWACYGENLKSYIHIRSRWFENTDFKPCSHGQGFVKITRKASFADDGSITQKCNVCGKRFEEAILYSPKTFKLSKSSYRYNAKARKPAVKVMDSQGGVISASNYAVTYSNNINAGKAIATVSFKGEHYRGSKTLGFSIEKGANPLRVKGKAVALAYCKVKKKTHSLKASKAIALVRKGQGRVSYTRVSGDKRITVNRKTGKVTVKKGLVKGKYKVKVKVKASGNANFKAVTRTMSFKVLVK